MTALPANPKVFGPNGETEPLDLLANHHHGPGCWPLYNWMLEEAPLYRDANGIWHVVRYDDVVRVANDSDTFTSRGGNRPLHEADESFMHRDGHEHLKRRGHLMKYFQPSFVSKMEDHIREVVDELLDEVIESGACDLVEALTAPLPVRLICELTGIPRELHAEVREVLDVFVPAGEGPDRIDERVNEAYLTFGAIHYQLMDERMAEPKDDFMSLWLRAKVDGRKLTEDEILWDHTNLIVGGSDTTRHAISGGLWMLAQHPEQWQALVDGTADLGNAAEEIVRWTAPFVGMSRTATQDVEMHGQTIREGDEVLMLWPVANRDPRKWEDPHTFDIRRDFSKTRSLAFGWGRHVCLGAHLARLEVTTVLKQIITRMPDYKPHGEPTFMESSFLRGMHHFPVTFTPGRRVNG